MVSTRFYKLKPTQQLPNTCPENTTQHPMGNKSNEESSCKSSCVQDDYPVALTNKPGKKDPPFIEKQKKKEAQTWPGLRLRLSAQSLSKR
jgi:hypothetical protein